MDTFLKLLDSHSGRGSILRTVQYGSQMIAGLKWVTPKGKERLLTLSSQLSLCRTILRLFDDLPMLSHSLSYGLGSQEKSIFMRLISVVQNLIDQLFFPIEHIAWASDLGILSISSERWNRWCVYCWFISLSLGIIRNVISLSQLRIREAKKKDANSSRQVKLSAEEVFITMSLLADMADLVIAIHYMPPGFLWSGKLTTFYVGLFGFISSLIPLWRRIQCIK